MWPPLSRLFKATSGHLLACFFFVDSPYLLYGPELCATKGKRYDAPRPEGATPQGVSGGFHTAGLFCLLPSPTRTRHSSTSVP